jgi:hypothetical protein
VLATVDGYNGHRTTAESLLGLAPPPSVAPAPPIAPSLPRSADIAAPLEVERVAIESVAARYRSLGYSVTSVERDRVGWDLAASMNGQLWFRLEVKGLSADLPRAELTPNEFEQMQAQRSTYRVCLVTNARAAPVISEFSTMPGGNSQSRHEWARSCQSTGLTCRRASLPPVGRRGAGERRRWTDRNYARGLRC